MSIDTLFRLHSDLPREGPGSDAATLEALRRLPALPSTPRVLDLGCGPGRQTLVLARQLAAPVVAVDIHSPYLEQLRRDAATAGLADRVEARQGSMDALDEPPESVDLIWSEGAIYILGFGAGLRLWRPLLRPGGLVAVTEATWLTDDPPAEARAFWEAAYPAMGTVASNIAVAEAEGYSVFDHFSLPQSAWWDEYLTPLARRCAALRPTADAALLSLIEETEREIDIVRRYGDSVGYVFYLMRRADPTRLGSAPSPE